MEYSVEAYLVLFATRMSTLTRSKSLFAPERPKGEGYLSPKRLNEVVSAVDDDTECSKEDKTHHANEEAEGVHGSPQEGPFSALTQSMRPNLCNDKNKDEPVEYDEFGFKLEVEDGPEHCSNKLLSGAFQDDDPQKRLQWIAHLEFGSKHQGETLTWDKMVEGITRTEKLR